jgi:hypothetical protein
MDSGAIDHITFDLEKLTIRDKYHGSEHVHAANGLGMEISHVGHIVLCNPQILRFILKISCMFLM